MYLRCTPGLATAVFFTCMLALLVTVDVADGDMRPTVFSNALEIAAASAWLYWFSGVRLERQRGSRAEQDGEAIVRQIKH